MFGGEPGFPATVDILQMLQMKDRVDWAHLVPRSRVAIGPLARGKGLGKTGTGSDRGNVIGKKPSIKKIDWHWVVVA